MQLNVNNLCAGKDFCIVQIHKKLQTQKREMIGKIYIPPAFVKMANNLQWGKIINVGTRARKIFPDAETGDVAIIHHSVESNSNYLVHQIPPTNDEVRVVRVTREDNNNQLHGVLKLGASPYVIPFPDTVFLSPVIKPMKRKYLSRLDLSFVEDNMWYDEDRLVAKLADLKKQIDSLATTIQHTTDVETAEAANKRIAEINKERQEISIWMNAARFGIAKVEFIHPSVTEKTGIVPGMEVMVRSDVCIAQNVEDMFWFLVHTDYIFGIFK